jgi:hypothetical protein
MLPICNKLKILGVGISFKEFLNFCMLVSFDFLLSTSLLAYYLDTVYSPSHVCLKGKFLFFVKCV